MRRLTSSEWFVCAITQAQNLQDAKLVIERCMVTGVTSSKLPIASHIKLWATSANKERLNALSLLNGLPLPPPFFYMDKLFDSGLMSFEDSGEVLFFKSLDVKVLTR